MAARLENAIASDDNSDMPQTHLPDSTSDIFPFYDLPREMRDEIYSLIGLHGPKVIPILGKNPYDVKAVDRPIIHCLVVCKQFRSEYLDSIQGQPHLLLEDYGGDLTDFKLSKPISSVTRCDLVINAPDDTEVLQHFVCISGIIHKLHASCKLNIKLLLVLDPDLHVYFANVQDRKSEYHTPMATSLAKLASLPRLSTLQIHRADGEEGDYLPLREAHPIFKQVPTLQWT